MDIYIAYGSNLNDAWMDKMCPNCKLIDKAIIKNARLRFRGHGYLNLEIGDFDSDVNVAIWKIDKDCEKALDEYEEYPELYDKEITEVETENGKIKAFYYKMNEPYSNLRIMPTKEYVETVWEGYKFMGFDFSQLEEAIEEIGFEK